MAYKPEKITKTKAKATAKKLAKHFRKTGDAPMLAAVETATDQAEITELVLAAAGVNLAEYSIG